MKHSIKTKLTFFVLSVILFVIAVQTVVIHYVAYPYFVHSKTAQMETLYAEIGAALRENPAALAPLMHAYEEEEHIWAAVWEAGGTVHYASSTAQLVQYQQDTAAFSAAPAVTYGSSPRTSEESLMLLGEVSVGAAQCFIALDTPIAAVHHSVRLIQTLTWIVAAGALVLGSVLAWLLGRKVTMPLLEIDRVARNVAALNFSEQVRLTGRTDEIGILGHSINVMSAQLEDLIQKLQAANRRLEQDLEREKREDARRRQFMANISHEIKSPLALMAMCCENLKTDLSEADKAYYCDVVSEECLRLGQLVQNMLRASSLEHDLSKMEVAAVDLSAFAAHICRKNRALFKQAGLCLDDKIPDGLSVRGNAPYLEQAVQNFLNNARRFAPQGSTVTLSLSAQGGNAVLSVRNGGPPLAEDDLAQIGDSFYKADHAHTQGQEVHAGLGLYIVRSIVTAHGGACGAENTADGVRFWFALPLAAGAESTQS